MAQPDTARHHQTPPDNNEQQPGYRSARLLDLLDLLDRLTKFPSCPSNPTLLSRSVLRITFMRTASLADMIRWATLTWFDKYAAISLSMRRAVYTTPSWFLKRTLQNLGGWFDPNGVRITDIYSASTNTHVLH
ncbi:hypothetical protein RRF57_003675 [Xylaria bambusicola]|uniref:Uncharacterized protein n=1 Tax=Xylaria bambusicola TaxID=326684 RepID=A0AAN7U8P0_9PEZI